MQHLHLVSIAMIREKEIAAWLQDAMHLAEEFLHRAIAVRRFQIYDRIDSSVFQRKIFGVTLGERKARGGIVRITKVNGFVREIDAAHRSPFQISSYIGCA